MRTSAALVWARIWDFLIGLLILFPFLTGGIWIQRPGLFIELSDLAIPVLFAAVLTAILTRVYPFFWNQSAVFALATRVWARLTRAIETAPARTLCFWGLLVAVLWSAVALRRHATVDSHAYDLGYFTHAFWNFTHGLGYRSFKDGMNLMADHQEPVFLLIAPVFRLWPGPAVLLVLQSAVLALSAVPVYFLARQYRTPKTLRWAAAALPFLYWLYLPVRNANVFDFHPEVCGIFFFLWGIVGVHSTSPRSRVMGLISLLIGLGCKESYAIVAVGVGAAWIFGAAPQQARDFSRRAGWVLGVLGAAVFVFDTRVVPGLFGAHYIYDEQFQQYGGGILNIVLSPFLEPRLFFSQIFGKSRLLFLFWTLAPLGFLPLLGPRALIAAIPSYLALFLTEGDHRVTIAFHYGIEPAIGLFWAAAVGISRLRRENAWIWILFWALGTSGRSEMGRLRAYDPSDHARWLTTELVPCVSDGLSLSASEALVPHLSLRNWVSPASQLTDAAGAPVSCVILDPGIQNWPLAGDQLTRIEERLPTQGYHEALHCGEVRVFEKSEPCLKCEVKCPS